MRPWAAAAVALGCASCLPDVPRLRVGRAARAPVIDGRLDDAAWRGAARTGGFGNPATGEAARPHTEARFAWDEEFLYVGLYAADRDLSSEDAVSVRLRAHGTRRPLVLRVTAGGTASHVSGTRLAVDRDGTLDDPRDEDEEWTAEIAVSWSALGRRPRAGGRVAAHFERPDGARAGTILSF